ncbi:hypothetical protein TNCV_4969331 [Trichonephila clavipes]|nr:hypothetical protein TNCV_4969331 [Trichonephila clavipes]
MDSSPPTPKAFMVSGSPTPPARSGSLPSFGSNLYPPPPKSLFFRALLLSPKKTVLHTRAAAYGPCNFEPRSSDEDDPFSKLPQPTNRGTLGLNRYNGYQHPLHSGCSVLPGVEPATLCPQVHDYNR